MNWWDELAGNKQYPSVPEREAEGDFRYLTAILCILSAAGLILAGLVAVFIVGRKELGLWAIGIAFALIGLGNLLIPSDKPRRKSSP